MEDAFDVNEFFKNGRRNKEYALVFKIISSEAPPLLMDDSNIITVHFILEVVFYCT